MVKNTVAPSQITPHLHVLLDHSLWGAVRTGPPADALRPPATARAVSLEQDYPPRKASSSRQCPSCDLDCDFMRLRIRTTQLSRPLIPDSQKCRGIISIYCCFELPGLGVICYADIGNRYNPPTHTLHRVLKAEVRCPLPK